MDLSTALTISLFFYGIFLILIGVEYFTDKRKQQRAPLQKSSSNTSEPHESSVMSPSEQLEDLEAGAEREGPSGSPVIWKEEDFE